MNLQEIYDLMEKFEASSLAELEVQEESGARVSMKKAAPAAPVFVPQGIPAPVSAATAPAAAETAAAPAMQEGTLVKAPLVGTFYRAPSPDAPPFVEVGSRVKKGDTICLIEAMKMINEIPAPADGVIEEILVENESVVEYDAPLFRMKELA